LLWTLLGDTPGEPWRDPTLKCGVFFGSATGFLALCPRARKKSLSLSDPFLKDCGEVGLVVFGGDFDEDVFGGDFEGVFDVLFIFGGDFDGDFVGASFALSELDFDGVFGEDLLDFVGASFALSELDFDDVFGFVGASFALSELDFDDVFGEDLDESDFRKGEFFAGTSVKSAGLFE
jgi:hypothetical protein